MDDADDILAPIYRVFPDLADRMPPPDSALYETCRREGEPEQVALTRYRLRLAMGMVTPETCEVVRAAMGAWLRRFPDDPTIIFAADMVARLCGSRWPWHALH